MKLKKSANPGEKHKGKIPKKVIRNFYIDIRIVRKTNYEVTKYKEDKGGKLIGHGKEKLKRWREYFEALPNGKIHKIQFVN